MVAGAAEVEAGVVVEVVAEVMEEAVGRSQGPDLAQIVIRLNHSVLT